MGSYSNFQSDNKKYTKNRYDIYNPDFQSTIKTKTERKKTSFQRNLGKWTNFVSWCRFSPDLFLDLITPETGGIRLDLDQRVYLRSLVRFVSTYNVFPRGWGKTFLCVLGAHLIAIFYPDIDLSFTAQSKHRAANLLKEKHDEIIKSWPLLANEIKELQSRNDYTMIHFTSGSRIDILANSQSSKGVRRKRLLIDESALLNDQLYQDVLEPITNIPRRTVGPKALVNPEEINSGHFFHSTSGVFLCPHVQQCA